MSETYKAKISWQAKKAPSKIKDIQEIKNNMSDIIINFEDGNTMIVPKTSINYFSTTANV